MCPYCGVLSSRVLDSRPRYGTRTIWRRRECKHCGERYTTIEHATGSVVRSKLREAKRLLSHTITDINHIIEGWDAEAKYEQQPS